MDLSALALPLCRSGQAARLISQPRLMAWAEDHRRTAHEAVLAALQAGILPECYERNFPCLNVTEQLRLFESCVLIVGLGGLGGHLANLLGRLGVGRFFLLDGDVFTATNLNRQLLATQRTLGRNKARVAAQYLQEINPAIDARAIPHFLEGHERVVDLSQVQVALDGLDNFAARRQLLALAGQAGIPVVHGAVAGRYGQVSTVLPEDKQVFEEMFAAGPAEPPATLQEVLGPLPALVAALQAQEAVRLLLGQPPAYHRALGHFDGDTGRLEVMPL